jgi:hypothetical protein
MKNPPKIIKGIRAAFMGFRWLFAFVFIATIVAWIRGPQTVVATVSVTPELATITRASDNSAPVHVREFKADVRIPVGNDSELRRVARLAVFPPMLIMCIAGFFLCEVTQRLIGNFTRRELFSTANAGLLRAFAVGLVVSTIVVRMASGWANSSFGAYAAAHLAVAGGRVLPVADHIGVAELNLDLGNADILVFLLLLLVVWAIKEGLAIKQENDLTV